VPLLDTLSSRRRICIASRTKSIQWNQDLVCFKELTVTGTNASAASAWFRALKIMAEGRVKVRRLVTHRFSLRAWDQALKTAQTKEGVKVLLKPQADLQ